MTTRVLIHDTCIADGQSADLQVGMSLLIEDGRIASIGPNESVDPRGAEVLDGGGATVVPAFVDCHSHLTMPGGSHWIDRGADPPDRLRDVARHNARRLVQAGILWARDVGSPADQLPVTIAVSDGKELGDAALHQLDAGADFVKIMLDGANRSQTCPFSIEDVRRTVEAVHRRGRRITAHATILDGARVGAAAGVDSIEHGMELNDEIARTMASNHVTLVSTLSILESWKGFERTTRLERFTSDEAKARLRARREAAYDAIRAARKAGVRIAAGTDFGGGSVRAGHLAWEVECLVEAGLEPWEALGAATWRGGELLGIDHAGRLREGDPADLVLVHGDPLSDPRALWRVWTVFQGGVRVA